MDVAFLIASGADAYRECAAIAVRALRRLGRFRGDIVVFSDRSFDMPGEAEVELLAPGELHRPMIKCHAARCVPLERYERVLYLDVDIVMRSPVEALLARCASGRLVCTDDMGARTRWDFFSKCFSPDELEQFGDLPGINSGFWCGAGARMREWIGHWEAALAHCAGCAGMGHDQPAFNAAIRRGLIPAELVLDQMWFPANHWNSPDQAGRATEVYLRTRRSAPLAHFTGTGARPWQLEQMRNEYAQALLSAPFRAALSP